MAIVNLIPSQGRLQVKTNIASIKDISQNITYDTGYNGLSVVSINPLTVTTNLPNTSGVTSSGTINRGTYIKVSNGHVAEDFYYLAQGTSGTYVVAKDGIFDVQDRSYVQVGAGTVAINQSLPSGITSSGTINRGSYIKIGKGYYANDLYYLAQGTSGTYTISAAGTFNVADKSYVTVGAYSAAVADALPSGAGSSATVTVGKYLRLNPGYVSSTVYYLADTTNTTYTASSSGVKNVSTYRYVNIPSCGAATTSISISSAGKITASTSFSSAGWVTATSFSNTHQMTTQGPTTWNTVKDNNVKILNSGTYLTGNQLMRYVRHVNITAGNIKKGTRVIIGDGADTTRILDVTGTY